MVALVPLIVPVDQTIQESVFALDGGRELVTGVVGVVHIVHGLLLEPVVLVEREVDCEEVFHIPHEVVAVGHVVDRELERERELVEREEVEDVTPFHGPHEPLLIIDVVVVREVVELVVVHCEVEQDVVDHEVNRDEVVIHGPQGTLFVVDIVVGREVVDHEVVQDVGVGHEVVVDREVLPQGTH